MLESGAAALGCTVVPTGVGQTEMQVAAIRGLGINAFLGTPSFLKLIVEKADEMKIDISCLETETVEGALPVEDRRLGLDAGHRDRSVHRHRVRSFRDWAPDSAASVPVSLWDVAVRYGLPNPPPPGVSIRITSPARSCRVTFAGCSSPLISVRPGA